MLLKLVHSVNGLVVLNNSLAQLSELSTKLRDFNDLGRFIAAYSAGQCIAVVKACFS